MQSHMKLLCALIFLCVISYGLSIKCFDCRSEYDANCADPFDNSTILISDCEWEKHISGTYRAKMCQKTKKIVNGTLFYTRGCPYPYAGDLQDEEQVIEHYICKEEVCNTSSMLAPISSMMVMLIALPSAMYTISFNL